MVAGVSNTGLMTYLSRKTGGVMSTMVLHSFFETGCSRIIRFYKTTTPVREKAWLGGAQTSSSHCPTVQPESEYCMTTGVQHHGCFVLKIWLAINLRLVTYLDP